MIRSFFHACEALQPVVEKWLVTNPAVSWLFVRPMLLTGSENHKARGHGRRIMNHQLKWSAPHARDAWRIGTTTRRVSLLVLFLSVKSKNKTN